MKKIRKFCRFFYAIGVFCLVDSSHASNPQNKSIILDSNDVSKNGASQINSPKKSMILDDKSDMGYKNDEDNSNNKVTSKIVSPQNFQNLNFQQNSQKPIQTNEQLGGELKNVNAANNLNNVNNLKNVKADSAQFNKDTKNPNLLEIQKHLQQKNQKVSQFDDIPDIVQEKDNEKQHSQKDLQDNLQKDSQKQNNNQHGNEKSKKQKDDSSDINLEYKNEMNKQVSEINTRSNMREGISSALIDFNKEKMPYIFEKGMDLKYPFSSQRRQILDDLKCVCEMNFNRKCLNIGLSTNLVIGYCKELNDCYENIISYMRFVFLGESKGVLSNKVKKVKDNSGNAPGDIGINVDNFENFDKLSIVSELNNKNNKNIASDVNQNNQDQNLDLSQFMQNRDISAKPSYNGHIEKIQEKENSQILQRSNKKNSKVEKSQHVENDQSRIYSEQNEEIRLNQQGMQNQQSQKDHKKYYEKLKDEQRKSGFNVNKEDLDHLLQYISDFQENYPNTLVKCEVLCCFVKYDITAVWFLVDFLVKVQKTGLVDVTLMPAVWKFVNALNFFVDKR